MMLQSVGVLIVAAQCALALVCSSETIVTTRTTTVTSYTGTPSTSYLFLPGTPPAKREVVARATCNADNCLRALRATQVLSSAQAFCSSYTSTVNNPAAFPTYVPSECNASRVSSACSCLPTPTPSSCNADNCLRALRATRVLSSAQAFCSGYTSAANNPAAFPTYVPAECNASRVSSACSCLPTASATCTGPATSTAVTTTTVYEPSPATTETVYPCANPINNQGPTYGDASSTSDLGTSNSLYYLNTPEGASATACCNTCYFGVANCVQAYYYFYQGCVVSVATDFSSATGDNISNSCPNGIFGGLTYGPDVNPAFRSTGNIAGPCGVKYTNF